MYIGREIINAFSHRQYVYDIIENNISNVNYFQFLFVLCNRYALFD